KRSVRQLHRPVIPPGELRTDRNRGVRLFEGRDVLPRVHHEPGPTRSPGEALDGAVREQILPAADHQGGHADLVKVVGDVDLSPVIVVAGVGGEPPRYLRRVHASEGQRTNRRRPGRTLGGTDTTGVDPFVDVAGSDLRHDRLEVR